MFSYQNALLARSRVVRTFSYRRKLIFRHLREDSDLLLERLQAKSEGLNEESNGKIPTKGKNIPISGKDFQQLKAQVNYLQNKIMELRAKKKDEPF